MRVFTALFFSVIAASTLIAQTFEKDDHCVAWKTTKTMFLFSESEPVGKNCEISTAVLKDGDSSYAIRMTIPIDKFHSGEEQRDEDVFEILKGPQQPNLIVTTDSLTQEAWKAKWAEGKGQINAKINIGGRGFLLPIDFTIEGSDMPGTAAIKGSYKGKYQDFSLEPPQVAGGLIASVHENLELHFHLLFLKIGGGEKLISATK